jgi:NAD(P)H-hydrate epimerase
VLIGCGIGRKSDAFIRTVVRRCGRPMVIDADALKAIRVQDARRAILTPHRGEYRVLMEHSGLPAKLSETAFLQVRRRLGGNVILLKAPVDIIMAEGKIARNRVHDPVMAKAGTGDVLAGLCAGFLAQTKDLFRSACMAAYLNGAIGVLLRKEKGRTFIASDIVSNIYKVFK